MKSHSRAKRLVERFTEETGSETFWYEDQDLFLAWLASIYQSTTESTFKSYRKWLAAYAAELDFADFSVSIRGVASSDDGRPAGVISVDSDGTPKPDGDDTPSNQQVSERITQKELGALASMLMSKRGGGDRYKNGVLAFTWFQITVMTGIRPSEWASASLLKDVETDGGRVYSWVLEVVTAQKGGPQSKKLGAKESERRRRLILDGWTEAQMETLQLFLSQLPSGTTEFNRTQESVRQTLLLACIAAKMDQAVGLYTGRHLFASEVRRDANYSRYQLAAMLGHSDTINQKYYGDLNKNAGRTFNYPLPLPWPGVSEQVESVDRKRYALIYGSEGAVDMLLTTGDLPSH